MKGIYCILLAALSAICANAQVITLNIEDLNKYQTLQVRMTLQDAETSEAISFASVYIIPQGDTTITNFALSDENGDVMLEEVLPGKYEVNAEMIGYLPYKKMHELKGYQKDLGIIRLIENPEYIDASTITAIGNPITVKKDTIEYNASSFHVGENAMLEDLLKKMPGMEVGDDGSVSVNGEKVDKITVGGKTFFFDDPAMAVKNLPAKIVDKIKVIDTQTEDAQMSGIKDRNSKEKVMDVALKEEYKKGMFGNAKLGGGYSLTPKTGDELTDHKGVLFNANALMSAYGEKDQVVMIANGMNATDPSSSGNTVYVIYGMEGDEFDSKQGLATNATAGINYNTDRIAGLPATISASYKYSSKDVKEKTARTSFLSDGEDLLTDGFFDGIGDGHTLSAGIELNNAKKDKFQFNFEPKFSFNSKNNSFTNVSRTAEGLETLNSSVSSKFNMGQSISTSGNLTFTVKDLGKSGRILGLYTYYSFSEGKGKSGENSNTTSGASQQVLSLLYDKTSSGKNVYAYLGYTEPLSEYWSTNFRISSNYSSNRSDNTATDGQDGSYNDWYTNLTDTKAIEFRSSIRAQYVKGENTLVIGVDAIETENINYVKNLGTETTTGKDDWVFQFAPSLDYYFSKDTFSTSVYYSGSSQQPSNSQMTPYLNLADATMITTGNIYLKPYMYHYMSVGLRQNNRETFSFVNFSLSGNIRQNGIVQASWFDSNAIRYSVPVNSRNPSYNISGYFTYNQPFGKEKYWTFSTYANLQYTSSIGYQATSFLEGMNLQEFDYADFMRKFWGNADGDIFYSGGSGFAESRMGTLNYALDLGMKYQRERFSTEVHAYGRNQISRYSLNPDANINTWMHSYSIDARYMTGNGWEFHSKCNANFYIGYSAGFGAPQFNWNADISKTINTVSLGLKVIDILNQSARNLQRTATSEAIVDTYRNVLGRYFLFSVSFNFGKMNPKKSQAVQEATWNLAF